MNLWVRGARPEAITFRRVELRDALTNRMSDGRDI